MLDRNNAERSFEVGDRVMVRIPGLLEKLEESWAGPYEVEVKLGPVTYRVKEEGARKIREEGTFGDWWIQ